MSLPAVVPLSMALILSGSVPRWQQPVKLQGAKFKTTEIPELKFLKHTSIIHHFKVKLLVSNHSVRFQKGFTEKAHHAIMLSQRLVTENPPQQQLPGHPVWQPATPQDFILAYAEKNDIIAKQLTRARTSQATINVLNWLPRSVHYYIYRPICCCNAQPSLSPSATAHTHTCIWCHTQMSYCVIFRSWLICWFWYDW
jgi:hypothetical protein